MTNKNTLATCLLLLCVAASTQAGFITSSGSAAFARNNDASLPFANDKQDVASSNQIGYLFSVNSPITINSLGIWDGPGSMNTANAGTIGDGLEQSTVVSLWTTGGMLIAQTTVPAGTMGGTDEFAYAALGSNINLMAGDFIISANYEPGGNAFYNGGSTVPNSHGGTAALTTMSAITIKENRYGPQGSVPTSQDPDAGPGYIEAYVGPTATFTAAVPEPSSFLFMGLISTGALAWRRRQTVLAELVA